MSLKDQVYDLMQDGDVYSAAQISSALTVPSFAIEPVLRTMTIDGAIMSCGELKGALCWRRKVTSSRQPRLDEQVDEMLAAANTGHQPNDETKFVTPVEIVDTEPMHLTMPAHSGWEDEPHWLHDAMGWERRHREGEKSPPPMDSPLRWMGGKSKMINDLIQWYPEHDTYCECFGGSLKPFFAKPPSKIEVVNDFYGELINFWRVSTQWAGELADACNSTPASRTLHRLFQRSDGRRTPWERAVMFGALIRFSFNGKPWSSYGGSPASPPTKINKELLISCGKRLSDPGVYIENMDFRKFIQRYNKKGTNVVFFYLDPPYYKTAGYADAFPDEWHQELAELMVEIHQAGNKFLMTNSPESKKAYKRFLGAAANEFFFEEYNVKYSASGSASGRGDVAETIISNFKLKVSSQKRQGSLL